MIKRLMLISLLGLGSVGLLRTEAKAQGACEPTLLAFYGICVVMDLSDFSVEAGSVDVSTILKQLKNANTTKPALETVVLLQQVILKCVGGELPSIDVVVDLSKTQAIKASDVAKNGRFLADENFSDPEIKEAVLAVIGEHGCPPGKDIVDIAVTKTQVIGTLFSCANGGDQNDPRSDNPENSAPACVIADSLGKQCTVPAGQNPFATPFTYSCSTVCTGWELTNPNPNFCPQPVFGNELYPILPAS